MKPARVLIIFAHPNTHNSRVNIQLINAVSALPHVTVHQLYETYPNFLIDVEHEQQLLLDHDVIVLQHPVYWYNCPALLKEWLDVVLEHGWAYGTHGDKLQGKYWMQAVTAGGPDSSYHTSGYNNFSLLKLLRPFEQSAHLCGINYLTPFVTYAARVISEEEVQAKSAAYAHLIKEITQGNLPPLFNTLHKSEGKYACV